MLSHDIGVTTLVHLRQRVGVDEVQHSLEHPWLHVIDSYMACALLLHRAKEFRHEHRGTSTEHDPMRGERLVADLERDVRLLPGLTTGGGQCAGSCRMVAP